MDEPWEAHKSHIHRLFIVEGKPLADVMAALKDKGFTASRAQYEWRLKQWNFRQNLPGDAWKYVRHTIAKRKREGKESEVIVAGARVPPAKVQRRIYNAGLLPTLARVYQGWQTFQIARHAAVAQNTY